MLEWNSSIDLWYESVRVVVEMNDGFYVTRNQISSEKSVSKNNLRKVFRRVILRSVFSTDNYENRKPYRIN